MGYKRIRICDSCGDELKKAKNIFHLVLKSERFTDAAGDTDNRVKGLDLCERCADNVVTSLEKIAKKEVK